MTVERLWALLLPLISLVVGYVAWVVRDIRHELRRIAEDVRRINGRLGKTEQWVADHDRRDDDRFEAVRRETQQALERRNHEDRNR